MNSLAPFNLCKSNSPTVLHILNYCPTALNQKRFTWRHHSILLKLFSFMRSFLEEEDVLYADLPGKRVSENPTSTVPVSILATSARPDMVLIRSMEITLIELTVPYDSRENLNNARARKFQKSSYLELLGDLEAKATQPHLPPVKSPHSVILCQSLSKTSKNSFHQSLAPPSNVSHTR